MTDAARPSRLTANDRVRRLLTIVPWIASQDGPTIDAVCRRFGLTRAQLLADLEVVFMVGLYPFTPDELIDVTIEDDRVFIRLADYFTRPLRLTPDQALALVAAGASLRQVEGADPDGPLARGLAKVAAVLGLDDDSALAVHLGEAEPALLGVLRDAVDRHRVVELTYYSYGRDQRRVRVVEPHRVYAGAGQWYLDAYCRSAGADRRFRVDRIESAALGEETFPAPSGVGGGDPALYSPRPEDPRVVLRLDHRARWVLDQYPIEAVEEEPDGTVRATLAVSAPAWLERLLLRLGPAAAVVTADPPITPDIGARAARRVLARYRPAPTPAADPTAVPAAPQ